MIRLVDHIARGFLRGLEPERAHALALKGLRLLPAAGGTDDSRLAVEAFGLKFSNPVGVAAGFDKNGEAADAILRAGFGFAEAGTVTPQPQAGNPRPRLFRLEADAAVINRMGFNNDGHAAVRARLAARRGRGGVVGVNIGANKDSPDRIGDYVSGIAAFAGIADFFTVNISSPNTPGLRDLQQAKTLDELLDRVLEARARLAAAERRPVLVKIAPDLALADLDDIVATARRRSVDGMIVANTTVTRPSGLREYRYTREAGGLSGRPLLALSTRMLAETFVRAEGTFPLVGVGGIDSGQAALDKIAAGATLVQLYTGLVFHGLGLLAEIKAHLVREVERAGAETLAPLVGAAATARTAEPWPS